MERRPTALVTGASGGLGMELARCFARDGHDVVLVARGRDAMERLADELAGDHGVGATVIAKDLATPDAALELADEVASSGVRVDALVNDAGFNQFGPFAEVDERVMSDLLAVNVVALTQLARRFLPPMLERRRGLVINMASNAAFQPGPLMAPYYASKAYVLSLSIALHEEVRGSGVTVTALCPGPTATGFQARAAMEDSKLVAGRRLPSAAEVAAWGYRAARAGRPFAVHGARWKTVAFTTRLLPRPFVARLAHRAQERVER